jgi:hypothetical protein
MKNLWFCFFKKIRMVPVPVPQMNGTPGVVLEKIIQFYFWKSGLVWVLGLKLPINSWLTLSSRLFFSKKK